VWGPAPVDSYNHFKYFITFIDDFSRTTWVYLLKGKNKVFLCFKDFLPLLKINLMQKLRFLDQIMGPNMSTKPF
jgi:hypothetical protein